MSETSDKPDFSLQEFEPTTGTLTIKVHRYVVVHQADAVAAKMKEIAEERADVRCVRVEYRVD